MRKIDRRGIGFGLRGFVGFVLQRSLAFRKAMFLRMGLPSSSRSDLIVDWSRSSSASVSFGEEVDGVGHVVGGAGASDKWDMD